MEKERACFAGAVCEFCAMIYVLVILAGCTYLVFWKDQSGWLYLLAILLMGLWSCRMWSGEKKDADN